jgi:tetratricopeptide (TPR) repeat protein
MISADATTTETTPSLSLAGAKVACVGPLAGMAKRDVVKLVRQWGAVVVDAPDATVNILVIGEEGLPVRLDDRKSDLNALWPLDVQQAIEAGRIQVMTESEFWQRLGVVEADAEVRRLYTPGMLADLLGVPVAVVRRWQRRGLIRPVREVRRLAYFDFQEVVTARRLAELLVSGISPRRIENQLRSLRRVLPSVERPLAQLSAIVEGRDILLRQGDGLIDAGGQLRFDFEKEQEQSAVGSWQSAVSQQSAVPQPPVSLTADCRLPLPAASADDLIRLAQQYEDDEQLEAAEEAYRASLAAAPPRPEVCFQLAELLYRRGDLPAARERYYMAIELDADYVEARANLGCVLAELGQKELALAALEGALKYHGQYPDAHFHLARILCELARGEEAYPHWQAFLELAPESPWAEEARRQLEAV